VELYFTINRWQQLQIKKQQKTKLENVAIAMHCNLRLSDAEPVVLRFNYDNIPRLKSVNYQFLSFLMLIR